MEINTSLSNLQINKLTPNIGAEIICKNVFEDLSPNICNEIYKCLIENKVIFFRDQKISPTQHINFAKSFGDISQPGTQVSGATSSPSRVIVMGGMMAPNNTKTNAIHSITISSSGGAEDFGDLTRVKTYHYSTSDSHGGLGGF